MTNTNPTPTASGKGPSHIAYQVRDRESCAGGVAVTPFRSPSWHWRPISKLPECAECLPSILSSKLFSIVDRSRDIAYGYFQDLDAESARFGSDFRTELKPFTCQFHRPKISCAEDLVAGGFVRQTCTKQCPYHEIQK